MTDEGVERMRRTPTKLLVDSRKIIEDMKARLLTAFVTLGEFDVLSIVEARDEEHMQAIDDALSRTGVYVARNLSAVPVNEFLTTVARTPIFMDSWLKGREQARAAFEEGREDNTGPQMPVAASTSTGNRNANINERKTDRVDSPDGMMNVLIGDATNEVKGEVLNLAVGANMSQKLGFCFRVTVDDGVNLGLPGWTVGTRVPLSLVVEGDKDGLSFEGELVRVDLIGTQYYELGILYDGISRPQFLRLQRFYQRVKRSRR